MFFSYDKTADREVVRFTALGLGWGIITGLVFGVLVGFTSQPLVTGVVLALLTFLVLFTNVTVAKTLYWPLAILLQATGIVSAGIVGAAVGHILWFVALGIVPALRYVLQRENIISVTSSAIVSWLLCVLIWSVGLTTPGQLGKASLSEYVLVCTLIGFVFWGLAKIISSGFKEYHFKNPQLAPKGQ